MIKIIEGDLLEATEDIIGHSVNCRGVMGSGIAAQIKKRYPLAYSLYQSKCYGVKPTARLLGECQIVSCGLKFVANLFGQDSYGYGKQHTDIDALKKALIELKEYAKRYNNSVALPYGIGCGLGGARWSEVYKIIDEVFEDYEITLYKLG